VDRIAIALCVLVAVPACKDGQTGQPAGSPPPPPPDTFEEAAPPAAPASTAREMVDQVGYCTTQEQLSAVIDSARKLEADRLAETAGAVRDAVPFAALCPHDDHLYAARVALHAIPYVARADTVIVFGVTHRSARRALGDPSDVLLLDDYQDWISAAGHVPVDQALRSAILEGMPEGQARVSRDAHDREHSIEGLLPLLAHFNPDVRFVPIMVTAMDFDAMDRISTGLADVVARYARARGLVPGRDLSVLVSVDAVHYGPDFDHAPFGTDAEAHKKAVDRDVEIGKEHLAGQVTGESVEGFVDRVMGDGITWCGRYSVPFGLLTARKIAGRLGAGPLTGVPLRYGDSHTLGTLPDPPEGLGTTAPASLQHWVGYWAILYGIPAGGVTAGTGGTPGSP